MRRLPTRKPPPPRAQRSNSKAQQQQIVTFEGCTGADTPSLCADTPQGSGVFTAQIFDNQALYLAADGAHGGPETLSQTTDNLIRIGVTSVGHRRELLTASRHSVPPAVIVTTSPGDVPVADKGLACC